MNQNKVFKEIKYNVLFGTRLTNYGYFRIMNNKAKKELLKELKIKKYIRVSARGGHTDIIKVPSIEYKYKPSKMVKDIILKGVANNENR